MPIPTSFSFTLPAYLTCPYFFVRDGWKAVPHVPQLGYRRTGQLKTEFAACSQQICLAHKITLYILVIRLAIMSCFQVFTGKKQ
jgi:hypothetical protein